MFLKLNDFLLTGVKELISESKKLRVLFATYNNVSGYGSGIVPNTRDGLIIEVQNGNLDYSPETNKIFSPNLSTAIDMAREIKRENPLSKVVITTCDCDPNMKKETLFPLLESGEIDVVVVDSECGGRQMMGDILEKFLEA